MGWCSEDGTHEGYLVGLVPDEEHGTFVGHVQGRWRELGGRDEEIKTALKHVKAACSCGWRSPLLWAPSGTEFAPCSVFAPEWFEDACAQLWQRHVAAAGTATDGGYAIRSLLERVRERDH
jgi:hypothetical protein